MTLTPLTPKVTISALMQVLNKIYTPQPSGQGWEQAFDLPQILGSIPFNALLFGATGDGVFDSTTALSSARAASAYYLPAGTYLITDISILMDAAWFGPGNFLYAGSIFPAGTISSKLTLRVPSVFPTIAQALQYAQGKQYAAGGMSSILISPGSYGSATVPLPQLSVTMSAGRQHLEIVGSSGNSADVQLYMDATSNQSGIAVNQGASIANIANLTITGVGAWVSHGVWNDQSFGGGILAEGNATITTVANVAINKFYYGISARDGSFIGVQSTVKVNEAGDVGVHAFNGSTIICSGMTATNCSHVIPGLGGGFCAELGSSMHAENVITSGNNIAGITSQTGSSIWAQGAQSSSNGRYGFYASAGSQIEADAHTLATGNTMHGYCATGAGSFIAANGAHASSNAGGGFYAMYNAWIDITAAVANNNNGDGFHAQWGGSVSGGGATANSNGQCGFYCGWNSNINAPSASANGNGQWGFLVEYNSCMNIYNWGADANNHLGKTSPTIGESANYGAVISTLQLD